jgi:DNA-binding LytR/AlgR family response regulator
MLGMAQLNCIVIDDEQAGRKVIEEYIEETNYLRLAGSFSSHTKALELLTNTNVDLLFLDIQMPKMNGIDFLKSLSNPPITIMITAYSEYAVQGFELDVLDYLLKPISKERFLKACNKAREFWELKNKSTSDGAPPDHFFIKCNSQYEKIRFDDVLFVEAANNYVVIHTKEKKLNTYLTLKAASEFLPSDRFIKVHKSFIVSLDKIERIDGGKIIIQGQEIPVSRALRESVMTQVLNKNIIKR